MTSSIEDNQSEILSLIKTITPFNFLDDNILNDIVAQAKSAHYAKNSYIFQKGDRSKKTLFLILNGQAKALTTFINEEKVTAVRNRGDFFGVTGLLSDEPYPVSMVAAEALTCLLISQKSFLKALNSSEKFADYFTTDLASRLKDLYKIISAEQNDQPIIEKNILRQRIEDISAKNVVTCLPMDNIRDAAKKMAEARVSSVVVIALNNKPVGIITEKDLVSRVLSADNPNLEAKAHEIMTSDLVTANPNDYTYKALLLMIKHSIKHVIITDEHEILHGIITVKDLVQSQNTGALSIVKQIEYQDSYEGLAELIGEVDQLKQALINERSYASEICALISELYDRITRKVIQMAEKEMVSIGRGAPPTDYCFINMGSAGRKEQFSRSDQDNGIIFKDHLKDSLELTTDYFLTLGNVIVRELARCGFKLCKGEVMANNPCWCLPLSAWKNNVTQWVDKLDPKYIRNMTIFLDYRYVTGNEELYRDLKNYTTRLFRDSKHALLFMAEDDLKHRVPLNLFGRFITEKSGEKRKKMDLKRAVMVHLVDCLRLFALREGIKETNSFERLHRLNDRGIFKPEDAEYIEAAYESLLMFRIRNAIDNIKRGEEPDNLIDLDSLTKKEKFLLKESLLMANRLQSLTAHAFHPQKF